MAMDRKPGVRNADLARACKVSTPSVTNWLNGRTKTLKQDSARLAAAFLGCDQNWLAEGVGSPNWRDAEPTGGSGVVVSHVARRPTSGREALLRVGLMLASVPAGPRRTALAALMAAYVNDGGEPHYVDAILSLLTPPEAQQTADGNMRT